MSKALLIAEKPDLMRKIEEVYKKHSGEIPYDVTFVAQRGHLITLKKPNEMVDSIGRGWESLPIVPEEMGGWQYKIIQEKKTGNFLTSEERYKQIEKEIKYGGYDFIIHAGDPDQEGELLVRLVLSYANNHLPVKRFWSNDLTEPHILAALKNLKDDDKDPMLVNLLAAAYGRQHSDWRFGMNISSAAALRMNARRVSCGRVKTPILAIVCRREDEIRNFKPKTVYGVKAKYSEEFDGTMFDTGNMSKDENATADQKEGVTWFDTKAEAEAVVNSLPNNAKVLSFDTKRVETYAPKLYKLATLQIDAGKKGYNDKQTLDVIQKLYEGEYLSYPRTDCEYLSSDEDFFGILKEMSTITAVTPFVKTISRGAIESVRTNKRWINDKALQDSGHSALRPTTKAPDFSAMSKMEQDIYMMIVKRFIAIFLPPIVQDRTQLIASAGDRLFRSSGKTLISKGFAEMLDVDFSDVEIPKHSVNDVLSVNKYEINEKTTTCPKRYTSPDLIAVCENPLKFLNDPALKALGKKLKIGTPATRSGIIRTLIDVDKYMEEKKSGKTTYIYPTSTGEAIIRNLDGLMISRVDMTGIWEEQLEDIRSGKMTLASFESGIRNDVVNMIAEIKSREMSPLENMSQRKEVGTCPRCGKPVIESDKGFYCSGYKSGCKTAIYKQVGTLSFSYNDFERLVKGEVLEKEGGRKFYYDFDAGQLREKGEETLIECPVCGKKLVSTPISFQCACGFNIRKNVIGHEVTKQDIDELRINKKTAVATDYYSEKYQKNFPALLVLDKDGKVKMETPKIETEQLDILCPCCKKKKLGIGVQDGKEKFICECGFKTNKNQSGHILTSEDFDDIRTSGATKMYDGLIGSKGKEFSCMFKLNKKKKMLEYDFGVKRKRK